MSVGNRIRSLRRAMNLSQPQLAKLARVAQSTISDLENDKKSTSAENMQEIANVLNTTQYYLLTGESQVIVTSNPFELKRTESEKNTKQIFFPDIPICVSEELRIKFFEDISVFCGSESFREAIEKQSKRITVGRSALIERNISNDNCIALSAIGESMYPTIKDKDIVYIDLARKNIKDGKIFAICHGGLFKFKRLYQLPLGGVRIVSDNASEYPEERLSAQEIIDQQFEVIGWAWSWLSMEIW